MGGEGETRAVTGAELLRGIGTTWGTRLGLRGHEYAGSHLNY